MAILTVNGIQLSVDQNQKLLPFLRDTLRLTSVKNGCSEGACGTCMVLIDGKAVKACIQQTDKLDGKTIVTVEGLSPHEKMSMPMRLRPRARCSAVFARPAWSSVQKLCSTRT